MSLFSVASTVVLNCYSLLFLGEKKLPMTNEKTLIVSHGERVSGGKVATQ